LNRKIGQTCTPTSSHEFVELSTLARMPPQMSMEKCRNMQRIALSILVIGLVAGDGPSAIAENSAAGNPPTKGAGAATAHKSAKQTNPDRPDVPPRSTSEAEYRAGTEKARTEYVAAKARCGSRQPGDAMRTCLTDAKAARTDALLQARARRESEVEITDTVGDAMHHPRKDRNAKDGVHPATDDMGH